jgi:hypothetical protein
MPLGVVWCIPAAQEPLPVRSCRIARASVLRVFGLGESFSLVLEDLGTWGGAPSVHGWVGSTVNQHCQLRLEAPPWELGENGSGGAHGLRALASLGAGTSRLFTFSGYYGTRGSPWCREGGRSGAPSHRFERCPRGRPPLPPSSEDPAGVLSFPHRRQCGHR